MAVEMVVEVKKDREEVMDGECMKGVRHLCDAGVRRLPSRYVLPACDRPLAGGPRCRAQLPVVDLAELRTGGRASVLAALDGACREYGFFQVVNHGVPAGVLRGTTAVAKSFFELPFEARAAYMSSDIRSPVRYGTSFNQLNDGVLCWRDFLKLVCHPLDAAAAHWPSAPAGLREQMAAYAKSSKWLFTELMDAIAEAMGVGKAVVDEFADGTHLMIVNCFPACPEPDLTLGMPPHSDYGFLTLLLQDEVEGLQVLHDGEWILVDPIPDAFVVNVGDHLEMFSNGRYKSVLHRVRVNSTRSRISVANLHSMPSERVIRPAPELITADNPRRYMDTDFATFLEFLRSNDGKQKSFLESRRLT